MSTSSPIRIKIIIRGTQKNKVQIWQRQFPNNIPIWNKCKFIFDVDCEEYDWLVVYDDLSPHKSERFSKRKELLHCNPENTLLVTSEPSTIKVYGNKFLNQFGHVLTTQEPWVIDHKNAIYSQCGYRWFYGIGSNHLKDWDEISSNISFDKDKTISTVCSDKKQKNTAHNQRYVFTQKLKKEIPELDVFGRGMNPIDDKADAIDPYKYHVVIENISSKDHWSEKLADAFLGHSLPIYYGCTNVQEYFPEDSIIRIDPYDEPAAIKIIKNAIKNNAYEKNIDNIREARELVLNTYNFFSVVSKIIEENHKPPLSKKTNSKRYIKSRSSIRASNPINFIQYFIQRYSVKWKHFLAN
jgi:hypothetical protein